MLCGRGLGLVLVIGDLHIAKAAGVVADGGQVGGDLLRGGHLKGLTGQAVDGYLIQLKGGEAGGASVHRVEQEGGEVLVKEKGGVVPDDHRAARDGPGVQQILEQGLVLPLFGGIQGVGGHHGGVSPKEGGGLGGIVPVGDAQLVGQGPGGAPGEILAILIAQGPEKEGQELGGGHGGGGTKPGGLHPGGIALGVGVAHVGLGPVRHIGEGGGPGLGLGGLLRAQQAHQDGHGLGPGGGPLQGEPGGTVLVGAGTLEQA